MSKNYTASLVGDARERYSKKLCSLHGTIPTKENQKTSLSAIDPYSIPAEEWEDDIKKWPLIEYGQIYMSLVDTAGDFTREKLKAYKSLEAYNYFYKYIQIWLLQ